MKPLTSSQRSVLAQAVSEFSEDLGEAAEYLTARGIGPDTGVPERYSLGYVSKEVPGFERFRGMLCIPNFCAAGHVVGLKFRRLRVTGDQNKYDGPTGQVMRLFNLRALNQDSDWLVITEGEIDAISIEGLLGIPTIASPGTNMWKSHHEMMLEGYRRIVVLRDDDTAGSTLVHDILHTNLDVMVVNPPHGANDANEAITLGYADDLAAVLRKAGEEPNA